MITNTSFTETWLNALKQADSRANINPPLFEKMIYALLLAELLKLNGLDFYLQRWNKPYFVVRQTATFFN